MKSEKGIALTMPSNKKLTSGITTDNNTAKIIKHKIFRDLFAMLENKRVRVVETAQILPFVLHNKVKGELHKSQGISIDEVTAIEASILRDVESMLDFETVRDAPSGLFFDLKQSGETDLIEAARAVAVPTLTLNALLCEALEKTFSRAQILASGAFILREGCIRLDVDECHVRRGFITPVIIGGLITGLRVFRYPKDERPFILRGRNYDLGVEK